VLSNIPNQVMPKMPVGDSPWHMLLSVRELAGKARTVPWIIDDCGSVLRPDVY